jgi:hypothetical protein
MAFVAITAINAYMGDMPSKGLMSKGLASNPDLKPQLSSSTKFADVMGARAPLGPAHCSARPPASALPGPACP